MPAPHPPQQLDIFADSFDVMLRNDVLQALEQRDVEKTLATTGRLATAYPGDGSLAALQLLGRTLALDLQLDLQARQQSQLANHAALAAARQHIEDAVAPAARHALGDSAARAWLRPLWCGLAVRAGGLAFSSDHPDDHASALWLRGEDWAAAAAAVQHIESWRRIPAP